jgi:hypothetical protein
MKYRGIFEYEYPTEHKPPISIDVHLHGDCVNGKIIEWEYRPLEQEQQTFKWCTDCKEYDQEKHCCHRWSKVIRNTVEEMKQKYIEREVLDKIRAEIEELKPNNPNFKGYFEQNVVLNKVLEILDMYKAERSDKE